MVSPPYSLNPSSPANTDIAANFPALDRSDKAVLQAWLSTQLNPYGVNYDLLLQLVGSANGLESAPTVSANGMVLYYDTDYSLKQYSGDLASIEYVGVPPGSIIDYAGATPPDGYLQCYGQAISRTTYARLFAAISTYWGAGDGSTTFNVPDLRGRGTFGLDNMGGTAAGRISVTMTGTQLGETGGLETTTITQANLPNINLSSASLSAHTTTTISPTSLMTNNGSYQSGQSGGQEYIATTPTLTSTTTISGTVPLGGSGTAMNTISPLQLCRS